MNVFSDHITRIYFEPFVSDGLFVAVLIFIAALTCVSAFFYRKNLLLRFFVMALFTLALLNPSLLQKERERVEDVALVLVDDSMSNHMGQRQERIAEALTHLQQQFESVEHIDFRIVRAPEQGTLSADTRIFEALDRAYADVPPARRAGVVILSDGQLHDVPNVLNDTSKYGPIHTLLSGDKDEKDRRIDITQNPSYGIVGDSVSVSFEVTQTDNIDALNAQVTLNRYDGAPIVLNVPVGAEQTIELPIEHAGENIFDLRVDDVAGEITNVNNRASIRINGVRDRLKVLLVSGKPHAGGRTWRDLLTSDPGVDLVHFTILREPEKLDATPQNELALIAFPFRELFEIKLYDFDLIVFDRYKLNRILPQHYFNNIATYVREGGALLDASGPAFAGEDSIFYTDIGGILPAAPDGNVLDRVFKPHLNDLGRTHPVTENLSLMHREDSEPSWGAWMRQVSLNARGGDTIMTGIDEKPLLVLDRVDEGRVAQIASDHIWLWSRGFDGGGPHAELLRRTVHWLMKEPELDERALKIDVNERDIRVRSREPKTDSQTITMTKPDGSSEDILLKRADNGYLERTVQAEQLGTYAFTDQDGQKRFAIVGENNPIELRDVLSSDAIMNPIAEATKGGVIWLEDAPRISIKSFHNARNYAGKNWIAFRDNQSFTTKSVVSNAILPPWAWLVLMIGAVVFGWWREGRRA